MTRPNAREAASSLYEDGNLSELIALVGELNGLIAEENTLLARGMPASISQNVVRKARLSSELDQWMARIRDGDGVFTEADTSLHRDLVEQLLRLRDGMKENMNRLKRAIAVTRWRIEAIMSAVREQTRSDGAYDRSGTRRQADERAIAGGHYTA